MPGHRSPVSRRLHGVLWLMGAVTAAIIAAQGCGAPTPPPAVKKPGPPPLTRVRDIIVQLRYLTTAGQIDELLDRMNKVGVKGLSVTFKDDESGELFFATNLPGTRPYPGFDPALLGRLVEGAHKRGIAVWAWIPTFNDPVLAALRPELAQVALVQGSPVRSDRFVNPFRPEVRAHELGIILEAVKAYPVDGVMIDHVRYDNQLAPADTWSQEHYRKETGGKASFSRDDPGWEPWLDFRAKVITGFIKEVQQDIRKERPGIRLGAYLLPFGAQWEEGYLGNSESGQRYEDLGFLAGTDCLCPMVYFQDWGGKTSGEWGHWIDRVLKNSANLSGGNVVPVFSFAASPLDGPGWDLSRAYLLFGLARAWSLGLHETSMFYYGPWPPEVWDRLADILAYANLKDSQGDSASGD